MMKTAFYKDFRLTMKFEKETEKKENIVILFYSPVILIY